MAYEMHVFIKLADNEPSGCRRVVTNDSFSNTILSNNSDILQLVGGVTFLCVHRGL